MDKLRGFMHYPRENMHKDAVDTRRLHFLEFEKPLPPDKLKTQAARCMDCGVPFCNSGCPISNLIPEFNNLVFQERWEEAYYNLASTNNFPEFTGRICPAPCEPACTVDIVKRNSPVTIKQLELSIIEKAFALGIVRPKKNIKRTGAKVAIIGSGPAGLAAADQLNSVGYTVTVFEKQAKAGGLLRYGIPDFKLEKHIIDRRLDILEAEGVEFRCGVHVGAQSAHNGSRGDEHSLQTLLAEFDALCLCCGAEEPRPLEIPGADKAGVHFAMHYLTQQNKQIGNERIDDETISAKDKHVVVIGGGDTGSDCVGTGIRQGCKSMTQIQIHKKPPLTRYDDNPWPHWPKVFSTSSSQEEGCVREFAALTESVVGGDHVEGLRLQRVIWPEGNIPSGNRDYTIEAEVRQIPCDLLLISLGFQHCTPQGLVEELALQRDRRGNVQVNNFHTSHEQVFAAGDMVEGANLVVTAIAAGRGMARAVDTSLRGYSYLP